jgi:hypothetical protein
LATAEVILEQNVDPGWFVCPLAPTLERGGMRGGGWYHNSVKLGIFKNSVIYCQLTQDWYHESTQKRFSSTSTLFTDIVHQHKNIALVWPHKVMRCHSKRIPFNTKGFAFITSI